MPQELEIKVTKDGAVEIKVKGVSGPGCEALTKDIEDALGTVTSREKTGEYFQETEQTSIKVGR